MPSESNPSILEMRIERIFSLISAASELMVQVEEKYRVRLFITDLRKDAEQNRYYSAPKDRSFPAYQLEARAAGVTFALLKEAQKAGLKAGQREDYLRLAGIARQIGSDCRKLFRVETKELEKPVDLIPPQQPAPIRVAVDQGNLILQSRSTNVGVLRADNISRVRTAAAASLQIAMNDIAQSANVDQRITPVLKCLSKHLRADPTKLSPEALGLNAQIVEKIVHRCRDELPVVALIQIEETLAAIQVVLSQFEEWRLFKIAETSVNASPEQSRELIAQAVEFSNDLGRTAQITSLDPEIVSRFEEMVGPLRAAAIDYDLMTAPLYATFNNVFAGLIDVVLQADIASAPLHGRSLALVAMAYGFLRKYAEPLERFPPLRFVKTSLEWIEKYSGVARNIQ